MTTATPSKTPRKKAAKAPPFSVAESRAMVQAIEGISPKSDTTREAAASAAAKALQKKSGKIIGKAADYAGWDVNQLISAGVTIEHNHAAWKAAMPPEVFSEYWEKQFAELSDAHTECASQIRGARSKLYQLLVLVAAMKEKYDNPPALNFNSTVESVIRAKLDGLGLLPKNPNYSELIIAAAIHPAERLPDAQADKARREAIQKKCSTYKKVFQEAAKANITSANMLPWLEEHGVEAIRLSRWKTKEQEEAAKAEADRKAAAEVARVKAFASSVRNSPPKFFFPVTPKDIAWNADQDHHEMVLLATYRPTSNTIEVMHVAKSPSAFDAVIRVASKAPPPAPVVEEEDDEEAEA